MRTRRATRAALGARTQSATRATRPNARGAGIQPPTQRSWGPHPTALAPQTLQARPLPITAAPRPSDKLPTLPSPSAHHASPPPNGQAAHPPLAPLPITPALRPSDKLPTLPLPLCPPSPRPSRALGPAARRTPSHLVKPRVEPILLKGVDRVHLELPPARRDEDALRAVEVLRCAGRRGSGAAAARRRRGGMEGAAAWKARRVGRGGHGAFVSAHSRSVRSSAAVGAALRHAPPPERARQRSMANGAARHGAWLSAARAAVAHRSAGASRGRWRRASSRRAARPSRPCTSARAAPPPSWFP